MLFNTRSGSTTQRQANWEGWGEQPWRPEKASPQSPQQPEKVGDFADAPSPPVVLSPPPWGSLYSPLHPPVRYSFPQELASARNYSPGRQVLCSKRRETWWEPEDLCSCPNRVSESPFGVYKRGLLTGDSFLSDILQHFRSYGRVLTYSHLMSPESLEVQEL